MIKVNGKTYQEATTYDYDNLIIDKARNSVKIVCNEDIREDFIDGVEWYKGDSEDTLEDMSSYSKKVFSGKDELLGTYIVVMSKWTNEELLESMINDLLEV